MMDLAFLKRDQRAAVQKATEQLADGWKQASTMAKIDRLDAFRVIVEQHIKDKKLVLEVARKGLGLKPGWAEAWSRLLRITPEIRAMVLGTGLDSVRYAELICAQDPREQRTYVERISANPRVIEERARRRRGASLREGMIRRRRPAGLDQERDALTRRLRAQKKKNSIATAENRVVSRAVLAARERLLKAWDDAPVLAQVLFLEEVLVRVRSVGEGVVEQPEMDLAQ